MLGAGRAKASDRFNCNTMPDFDPETDGPTFNPLAGAAAWLFPGLGHIVRGERRRGRIIMFGVLFLVLSGLLIGGVDCVDRVRDRLWFLAQSVCGPIVFAADLVNQHYVQRLPDEQRHAAIALNRPNEMGTLFVALAGLMNLVVIMDATFGPKRDDFIDRRRAAHPPTPVSPPPQPPSPPSPPPPLTPSDPGAIT